MDETPDDLDQPKVVPFPQGSRKTDDQAVGPQWTQDQVRKLLEAAEADNSHSTTTALSRNEAAPAVVQVVMAPTEQGPPPGHINGMHCPQCGMWAWKGSAECWNCRYAIGKHLERQAALRRAERQARMEELIQNERGRWMRRAGTLAMIALGMMISFNSVPAVLSGLMLWGGFALLAVACVIVKLYE